MVTRYETGMSYGAPTMDEHESGDWVRHEDVGPLQERIELLEKALTIIGMGQSRCVEPPEFRYVHREYIEHALKMVDIQDLYKRYPEAHREVTKRR